MSCTGENCDTTNYTLAASYATSSAGKFGLCRGVWDEEQKRFLPATETDTMWCCLNVCKTSADACLQACMKNYGPDTENGNFKDYSDCRNNCGLIILSCENNCALSGPDIWRGNSPIIDCVKDKGCGSYPNYDTDCIKKNKDDLIRCCRKGCIPSSQMSCTDHCNRKYDDFAGTTKDPLLMVYNKYNTITPSMYKKGVSSGDDDSWKYYLIVVAVVLVIVFTTILIIRR